ncbi:MAG: DUF357 domain-containing protein [Candidatus Marsarchaeota archaeon]|nr:DUF357 domain-containing protein [Candidatus Marsarchaeota archaeon]MCL5115180.1 DUF357 domain-containing protein [Candidatus Marsarchaeota archaeon]
MPDGDSAVKARIEKDISLFRSNIKSIKAHPDKKVSYMLEMAKRYASDSESYLSRNDFYTAFSCISYAHGILDCIKEIFGD